MVEFLYSYITCYLLVGMLFSMNAIELDLKELLKKDEKKGESSKGSGAKTSKYLKKVFQTWTY
ncbi:hypothetical protein B5P41_24545 [Bacillus sp. SRB_28]|nr:hypothetical protein B5P41_24545 [Bacillus sp. SRB_28]